MPAWLRLPPYYMQSGYSAQFSGTLLALMTIGQTGGALLLPILARHEDRRTLLMLALALQLVGFCGFIWHTAAGTACLGHLLRYWAWRRISAVSGPGARSRQAPHHCGPTGRIYAGSRLYCRRAFPLAVGTAAEFMPQLPARLDASRGLRPGLNGHNAAFCPRTLPRKSGNIRIQPLAKSA